MQEEYVMSSYLVDLEDFIERPTRAVLKQGGWFFGQLGTYTVGSPLAVSDGVKTKIAFPPSQLSYSDSRNFTLNYDTVNNKFHPLGVGDCFIVNMRFKMKASSQAGHMDIMVESPTVAFNPILAKTITFNKQAGDEQFQGITELLFISQDVATNGLEIFVSPHDTNVQIYDLSILVSTQYSNT
jgi:hypothetical protein